jgi:hypothetical protein
MSDFFSHLASRALGIAHVAQPVIPAIFSPASAEGPPIAHVETPESAMPLASSLATADDQGENSAPNRNVDAVPVPARSAAPHASLSPMVLSQPQLQREASAASISLTPPVRRESGSVEAETKVPVRVQDESHVGESSALAALLVQPAAGERTVPKVPQVASAAPASESLHHPQARRDAFLTAAPQAPTIRVTIGRVDVRAEFPNVPSRPAPRRRQATPLSLEEYAKQRAEGKR